MIGLDTNVLVRYVAQDDLVQSAKATEIIESLSVSDQGFITIVSVVELVWVLQSCFDSSKEEVVQIIERLLGVKEIVVERSDVVWQALRLYTGVKADFADCLIERCASAAGSEYTVTFDKNASKIAGMRLL